MVAAAAAAFSPETSKAFHIYGMLYSYMSYILYSILYPYIFMSYWLRVKSLQNALPLHYSYDNKTFSVHALKPLQIANYNFLC